MALQHASTPLWTDAVDLCHLAELSLHVLPPQFGSPLDALASHRSFGLSVAVRLLLSVEQFLLLSHPKWFTSRRQHDMLFAYLGASFVSDSARLSECGAPLQSIMYIQGNQVLLYTRSCGTSPLPLGLSFVSLSSQSRPTLRYPARVRAKGVSLRKSAGLYAFTLREAVGACTAIANT